jgi:hypothetical protein
VFRTVAYEQTCQNRSGLDMFFLKNFIECIEENGEGDRLKLLCTDRHAGQSSGLQKFFLYEG